MVSANVTSIADYAFGDCLNLISVTVPASVTNMGSYEFTGSTNLEVVFFQGNAPTTGSNVFYTSRQTLTNTVVYYLPGTSGWAAEFCGIPAVMLNAPNPAGLLRVTINPATAAAAGAQWRVDSGIPQPSGATVLGLTVGSHTVNFSPISGWTAPIDQVISVTANSTAVASGTYTAIPQGSLEVSITPVGAINAGAQWQVDDGSPQGSGATVNLFIGSHVVSFTAVAGWEPPGQQTVAIATGATTKITGVYVQGTPKLGITSPKPGQSVSNAIFAVSGTATDEVPLDGVYYQLNGGSWTLATPSNSWSNWTASVTLDPGPNAISAYAEDNSGSVSSTNRVSFFYVVTAPLVVETNGRGTVSPDYNGQSLAIGSNYSMTATAATGIKFTDWTGGTNQPFNVLTNHARLSFQMASNLTLVANFVDTNPPALTVKSPVSGQRWSNAVFTVTGSATDNVAVSNVFYSINGGGWSNAVTANNWTNWTAAERLAPGTNTNAVYAVDTSGNKSPTNTVKFLYIPSAILTVQTNGLGAITPVDNGNLLAIGTNYTLTASPGHNWLFSNWVGGTTLPYPVLSVSSNYTFAMQSNLVLEANFVTNPFLAVAGVYSGLFYPASGVTEASSGFITATIASNSAGAYTAKLLLDGGSNSFSGSFDLTGTAQTNLARNGKTPVSVTLSLDFNPADALMGGSVSNAAAGWNSVIQADRVVFSTTANPATNYAGQFTLLLSPDTNAPVGSPDGYGYAAITNTLGGMSTLGGALADGTPFLWSAPIAPNGGVPLYLSLYSGKGSLMGWIYFTKQPPQNVSTNSSVIWIKPGVPGTLYPSGFTNLTWILGSPYTNTGKAGVPVLNLTNAALVLSNGNLNGGVLIFTNLNIAKNSLTNLAGGTRLRETNYLVLAINTNNGIVTVTFRPTGAQTNTIAHGAVLQNKTNAAGYFLGTNQSGAFTLDPR
jgi:hypothetical protein